MARVLYVDDIERVQAHVIRDGNTSGNTSETESIGAGKRSYDYVHFKAQGPLAGLIWKEVRKVLKKAHLTEFQTVVIEMHLLGFTDPEIAKQLSCVDGVIRHRTTIRQAREGANRKLSTLPHLGVLTVLYEEFSRKSINEYQTDKFENMLKILDK